jgi:signal transduction histidine kinase
VSEFIQALSSAGVPAALWDHEGKVLALTDSLAEWLGADEGLRIGDMVPGIPSDFASHIGTEIEVPLEQNGRMVNIRIGRAEGAYLGVFRDVEERYLLMQELNQNTVALEEKVIELSRSKRAILNILEDLEDRSRELSRRKEELEHLNQDLQHFNRELERANKELRTLDEMKSNLLSNISHELRTPLVAIKGYSDLIFREKLGPLTQKQRQGLEVSLKSQDRLLDLINNLLDFSRIEGGRLKLQLETFNLADLLAEVLSTVEPRAQERAIRLTVGEVGDFQCTGDRSKLAQVLTNLLTNAVKFNRDGGEVKLLVEELDAEVLFTVSDTGIGVPSEYIGRIFERFFQVESGAARRYGGTGIGLSIVKSLVELHGGSIQVESVYGEGSTFRVRLPKRTLANW